MLTEAAPIVVLADGVPKGRSRARKEHAMVRNLRRSIPAALAAVVLTAELAAAATVHTGDVAASRRICEGVQVTGSIRAAIAAHPAGTRFCLSGRYDIGRALVPKDRQSFIGPAVLVAANGNLSGFKLKAADADHVAFVRLDMSGFGLRAIECWTGVQIIGGRYHHNGRNGIGCGLDGGGRIRIDGVEVDHNGSEAELGRGSAGIKFARAHGAVVRDSFIHDNLGNGVWCDVQCGDFRVLDAVIVRNGRKGVHYEKSGASDGMVSYQGFAYIARNVIQDNGWEGREHAADGGVGLVSSKNVLIEDNVFGGNHRAGVFVRQDGRLSGDKHGWVISNVVIRNNIMNGDPLVGCDLDGVRCRTRS